MAVRPESVQSRVKDQKRSVDLNIVRINPVELPELLIVLDGIVVKSLFDTGVKRCFISYAIYRRYFSYKRLRFSKLVMHSALGQFVLIKEWLI